MNGRKQRVIDGAKSILSTRGFNITSESEKDEHYDIFGKDAEKKTIIVRIPTKEVVGVRELREYKEEIEEHRIKESNIKSKYGLKSLDFLLHESNDKLLTYQHKLVEGKDMNIAIINEEKRKEDFEEKRRVLVDEIQLERQITVSEPRVLGAAVILPMSRVSSDIPKPTVGSGMVRDDEIEKVGMEREEFRMGGCGRR